MPITPCVGICSTVYGDDVCRGCKRHFTEVINWNALSDDERDACWARLNRLAAEAIEGVIALEDEAQFRETLTQFQIRQKEGHEWPFQVIVLLKKAHDFIDDLADCGLSTTSPLPLDRLMTQVDNHFYKASQAALS